MQALLNDIRRCQLCAASLPLGPRPVVRASSSAKLLIIGQAPGTKVHASGIPWNDASGQRLRQWLDMSDRQFYDERQIAIVPMGFCYPGRGKSGDLPPSPVCAKTWHDAILQAMPDIELTLLIGNYAQQYYLADKRTLTDRVRHTSDYLPAYFPLPHPSPRNNIWLKKHAWFEQEILPLLRLQLGRILSR